MPVVIRELHVQVNVDEERTESRIGSDSGRIVDREALISECVEKIVEIMKREEQR